MAAINVQEQLRTSQLLKRVFQERVAVYREWEAQLQSTSKKRETKVRLELFGRGQGEKAHALDGEIERGETSAEQLESDFLTMSEVIRNEYLRYTKQRHDDIKKAIILYLELLIENEGRVGYDCVVVVRVCHLFQNPFQVLSYWETFGAELASDNDQ
jgi:Vps5 C terminal like